MKGARYIKGEKGNTWFSQELNPKTKERENAGYNNGLRHAYQLHEDLVAILQAHDEVYMTSYSDKEFLDTLPANKILVHSNEIVNRSKAHLTQTLTIPRLQIA